MPLVLARVTLPYTTNLPDDVAINTFVFDDTTSPGPATSEITDLLVDFYNTAQATTLSVGQHISEVVSRSSNVCAISLAEIIDPGPTVDVGPVYYLDQFTLAAAHGTGTAVSLPLEVAVVNTIKNDSETAIPIGRRRGRQYIGPLDILALDTAGPYPFLTNGLQLTLAQASETLRDDASTADVAWQIWSRAAGEAYPVTSGWINNEFDTQRRRGADATVREVWP